VTGFGALESGGLAWCEAGEVVELSGLGDVFARPTLNDLLAAGPEPSNSFSVGRAKTSPSPDRSTAS